MAIVKLQQHGIAELRLTLVTTTEKKTRVGILFSKTITVLQNPSTFIHNKNSIGK